MRLRRRAPFAELLEVQLDLFEADNGGLLSECEEALQAYDAATAGAAEERYGDYADLVDTVRERLELVRDGYSATLDEPTAGAYCAAFNEAARRRYPRYTLELE
jgi:hypothetical protein